jgi:hypothetical protein
MLTNPASARAQNGHPPSSPSFIHTTQVHISWTQPRQHYKATQEHNLQHIFFLHHLSWLSHSLAAKTFSSGTLSHRAGRRILALWQSSSWWKPRREQIVGRKICPVSTATHRRETATAPIITKNHTHIVSNSRKLPTCAINIAQCQVCTVIATYKARKIKPL